MFSENGLTKFSGLFDKKAIKHLCKRTLFGVSDSKIADFEGKSLDFVLTSLLSKSPNPNPPVVNYTNGKEILEPNVADGETWINENWKNELEYYRLLSLKTWWIDLQLNDETITEKMILFWHNHIPVEMVGIFHSRQAYDYLSTIRKFALGNFKELIKALTLEPLMLFYLNGALNEKESPDENYARELQELFCIGKGPDSKYTEEDVQAAARVLTGWKSDYLKPKTFFALRAHDLSDKKFSSFYGNKIIKGNADGLKELDELIDMIVSHPECAKFICRKLYRFFVYPQISDETEEQVIKPLAEIFIVGNFEILPVLKTLLQSAHFFDLNYRSAVIKTPLDYVLGVNKEFGMRFPLIKEQVKEKFQAQTILYYFLITMQQDIGDPPNVSGWPAFYQYPQYDKSWISTHTINQRGIHSNVMVYYGYQMFDKLATIDWLAYTDSYKNASDADALINDVLASVFDQPIDPSVKAILKIILLSGQLNEAYWTDAWKSWKNNPTAMNKSIVENRLKPFYQYILQLDEYQLY